MCTFKYVHIQKEKHGDWYGWVHRENGRVVLTTTSFADSQHMRNKLEKAYREHGVHHKITVDMRGLRCYDKTNNEPWGLHNVRD